jgi:hypothetical protein
VKSCGPDTSTLVSSLAEAKSAQPGADQPYPPGDGGKRARSPGRARSKLLKPLRAGMLGDSSELVVTTAGVALYPIPAHQAAGALGARHSPRPLFDGRNVQEQTSREKHAARSRNYVSSSSRPPSTLFKSSVLDRANGPRTAVGLSIPSGACPTGDVPGADDRYSAGSADGADRAVRAHRPGQAITATNPSAGNRGGSGACRGTTRLEYDRPVSVKPGYPAAASLRRRSPCLPCAPASALRSFGPGRMRLLHCTGQGFLVAADTAAGAFSPRQVGAGREGDRRADQGRICCYSIELPHEKRASKIARSWSHRDRDEQRQYPRA